MEENYFLSRFIWGLKHELQVYVLQCLPTTLLDAYELALVREYESACARKKTRIVHKEEHRTLVAAGPEDTTKDDVLPIHHLEVGVSKREVVTFQTTLPLSVIVLPSNTSNEVCSRMPDKVGLVCDRIADVEIMALYSSDVDAQEAIMDKGGAIYCLPTVGTTHSAHMLQSHEGIHVARIETAPDKALLDWNTRMQIAACVVSNEVVSKMTKSGPIIHEHVEENSVSMYGMETVPRDAMPHIGSVLEGAIVAASVKEVVT